MANRIWGEQIDATAARQLGLADDDYTIFLMASGLSHVGDLNEVEEEFSAHGYVDASDVIQSVNEHISFVELPGGLRFVGMRPLVSDGPKKYGIVDLSACEFK